MALNCPTISVIIPILNASLTIDDAMASVMRQSCPTYCLEVVVADDGSVDDSVSKVEGWREVLATNGIALQIAQAIPETRTGAGATRNRALAISTGVFIAFLDADDIMMDSRILSQLVYWRTVVQEGDRDPLALLGCRIDRLGETERYTSWVNSLTGQQLHYQAYCEVPMPLSTWFTTRATLRFLGDFTESLAEDLLLVFSLLRSGGRLFTVESSGPLLVYRHRLESMSSQTPRQLLLEMRVAAIDELVLSRAPFSTLPGFTIWNAGRKGRRIYRLLSESTRKRVRCFVDVDVHKIESVKQYDGIPIESWTKAAPPVLICARRFNARDNSCLEMSISTTFGHWVEGVDYYWF